MFLLDSLVFRFADDTQAKDIPVEFEACISITDDDGSVIYSEEESIARAMPFGIALAFGELKKVDGMPVRILEVKSLDARRALIPIRQSLRARRNVFDMVLT